MLAPAGTAAAHDGVSVTVTPSSATAGTDVDVRVSGCKGTTGAAKSKAFVSEAELSGRDGGDYPLFGDTTIRSQVSDGTYDVSVTCDGHNHDNVGVVHVFHKDPMPVHPVHAGGGGASAQLASDAGATEEGPGTPHTVIGLVLAGVAAVAVAFRSVRRRRVGAGSD
ncbi:hypothetical protein ABT160_03050 [Streptomyces sp. NPDC001941]|uniref:hypothetical protein n=1 Tax=Streptomyces sp. NPDC001941 TaxID=3154659 RepID=UPI00332C9E54